MMEETCRESSMVSPDHPPGFESPRASHTLRERSSLPPSLLLVARIHLPLSRLESRAG